MLAAGKKFCDALMARRRRHSPCVHDGVESAFTISGITRLLIEPRLPRFMRLTAVASNGNTKGMKVAVSIPDDVFAEAEALAKRLKSSRSEIYSRALGEFIGTHAPDRVTERMNDVVRDVGIIEPDAFSIAAARKVLKKTEW